MKTQLQKFKILTALLAIVGMLLSGYGYSAINISGSLTVTATGANPANTITNPALGVLVIAQRFSGSPAVVVGTYPTYTDASGNFAFTGLPISGTDYYVVRASAPLYYGAPSAAPITVTTAGVPLTLVFNKFGFNGGNGAFPLWEQFLSSASIDGSNLVDGDQIAVYDAGKCVGLMIFTSGLVTSNVFDPTNNLISYSTLSGVGFPAGYTSLAASSYKVWLHGAGAVSAAIVTPIRSNIDGVCYLDNIFPPTGLYTHSVTSLDFTTGAPFAVTIHVHDVLGANISGATVKISKNGSLLYTGTTAGTGNYITPATVTIGDYSVAVTKTNYTSSTTSVHYAATITTEVTLTPTGGISGHVVLNGTGDGIPGVTVTANPGGSTALTDMYGGFTISGLSDGTYTLTTFKTGYTVAIGSTVVDLGAVTTGVSLTVFLHGGYFDEVNGDPNKTWTIYLAQARINGVDMAPGDEIAVFDNSNGKIAGKYALTSVLTLGTALNHDLIAFRDTGAAWGFTAGHPYIFKCWKQNLNKEFYLESFTIDPASTWPSKIACPNTASPTYFSIVTLNFTDQDPSLHNQSIYLKPGINWVSSYITTSDPTLDVMFPSTSSWWVGADGVGGANSVSPLRHIKNTAGTHLWVSVLPDIGPPVVLLGLNNTIGDWVNSEGYIFTMNFAATLTITGSRADASQTITLDNSANASAAFFFVGNLLSSPVNASTAFADILSAGLLSTKVTYIKNTSGRMFWNIGGSLVNNIGNILPGEAYQFLVAAHQAPAFVYHATKSGNLTNEDYSTSHFIVSGNAADNVFTIYVQTSDFTMGDEIAAFDGDKLVGATKFISGTGKFDNAIPAFQTLSTGEGYQVGHPITLKAWSATENKEYDVTYTLENTNGAYYNTVFPGGDGKFCIATVKKSALGINDASAIVANIYPNPAHDYLKVVADRTIDKLTLMNIVGQEVAEKSVNGSSVELNTSAVKAGVYFLRIECNGQFSTKKVVIQ